VRTTIENIYSYSPPSGPEKVALFYADTMKDGQYNHGISHGLEQLLLVKMKTNSNTFDQVLIAASRGDHAAFEQLIDPYQHELLVHCYRILGSYEDAEDMLQETLLRAWRRLNSFERRSTLRGWLYKIATNVCLDALGNRKRRAMAIDLYPQGNPQEPLPAPVQEISWVGPLPEALIDHQPDIYPEARYETRESITLAFVAALQNLPGRQRAVLLLRDVLGWNTGEVRELEKIKYPKPGLPGKFLQTTFPELVGASS